MNDFAMATARISEKITAIDSTAWFTLRFCPATSTTSFRSYNLDEWKG